MYDRIAIVIRGYLRIWDWTKHNIFYYYDQLAVNVDYYLVTWADDTERSIRLADDFAGKNLCACLELPYDERYANAFYSSSWFAYNVFPYMQDRYYDAVFDTRADSFVEPPDFKRLIKPLPYTIHVTGGTFYRDVAPTMPQIPDTNFMCDTNTYGLLSGRYVKPIPRDKYFPPEMHLHEYCVENRINISDSVRVYTHVARPDICELDIHPITEIWPHYDQIRASQTAWRDMPLIKKIELCEKHGIPFSQYADKFGRR